MNSGAVKAARADRRVDIDAGAAIKAKVPRDIKRAWAAMSSKERCKLRRQWRASQRMRGLVGEHKHREHMNALKAFVKVGDLKL